MIKMVLQELENQPFFAVSIILKHLTVALFRLMISQLIFRKSLKKKSLLYVVSCLWFSNSLICLNAAQHLIM